MEPIAQGRLPTVFVIHHDVGNDPSVSVGDFLRGLKRVPCPSFSERRSLKWKSRSRPPLVSGACITASTRNVPSPVGHNDTADSLDQVQDITELREEKPTFITPRQVTSGDGWHVLSADTLLEQSPAGFNRCAGQQHASDSLGVAQDTRPESRLPNDVITYKLRRRKLRHNHCNEESQLKGKERRRRCADPNGLLLIKTVDGITDQDHTPKQRSQPQRPFSELKHDIQLSRSVTVNPTEFRFPPVTPSTTRRATWRLGSGFKGQCR